MNDKKVIDIMTKEIDVKVDRTDVQVKLGNGNESVLFFDTDLIIEQDNDTLIVRDQNTVEDYITIVTDGDKITISDGDGLEVIGTGKGQIQSDDRKTIMNRGQILSLSKRKFDEGAKKSITFVLGKEAAFDFVIATKSGNVQVNELGIHSLDITTDTGDIDLMDIDCDMVNVDTARGDVTVTTLDSLREYRSILKTIHGRIQQESFGDSNETVPVKKHVLDICSKYGDINVAFHQKQK